MVGPLIVAGKTAVSLAGTGLDGPRLPLRKDFNLDAKSVSGIGWVFVIDSFGLWKLAGKDFIAYYHIFTQLPRESQMSAGGH